MLADAAQVQGDKLYVLGGAWRYIHATQFPVMHSMAIAVSIEVGWLETNQRHAFQLTIGPDDSSAPLVDFSGEFETGRPAGIPPGAAQQVLLAVPVTLPLERAGDYVVRILLDGSEANSITLTVVDRARAATQ